MQQQADGDDTPFLFCFGLGYTALAVARAVREQGFRIGGTVTCHDKRDALLQAGIAAEIFSPEQPLADPVASLARATHVLLSVPPGSGGDPVFDAHSEDIAAAPRLKWLGYLSTTGVYGNRDGDWVDETATPAPTSRRGDNRLRAEEHWRGLHLLHDAPLHVFRLAGIYGPGRSALDSLRAGTARCIEKPGHMFNRMHVDDIAQTLVASMLAPASGAIYNLADDMPASPAEVMRHAAHLLDIPPPSSIDFDKADMTPMARSFYSDNKRIRNDRIKRDLHIQLKYPDYRAGLAACLAAESKTDSLGRIMLTRCGDG